MYVLFQVALIVKFIPLKHNSQGFLPQMKTYIAYHKPKGIICTTEKIPGNIIDAIQHPQQLLPIGRLDKNSEGLILLTNDKVAINEIIHPNSGKEKEYRVTVNKPLKNGFLKKLQQGVDIGISTTAPCKAEAEPDTRRIFRIVLTQGLNRQIRRMCAKFNYHVIKLERVRIASVVCEGIPVGKWRNLSDEEVASLLG